MPNNILLLLWNMHWIIFMAFLFFEFYWSFICSLVIVWKTIYSIRIVNTLVLFSNFNACLCVCGCGCAFENVGYFFSFFFENVEELCYFVLDFYLDFISSIHCNSMKHTFNKYRIEKLHNLWWIDLFDIKT